MDDKVTRIILNQFQHEDDLELEFRKKFDLKSKNIFVALYLAIAEKCDLANGIIDQSLNTIEMRSDKKLKYGNVNYYKKIKFNNGKKVGNPEFIKKTLLNRRVNPAMDYKLVLCKEEVIEKINTDDSQVFRVKLRNSFSCNDWRYDFTLSKSIDKQTMTDINKLRDELKKMLFPITSENFIENAPFEHSDEYEFEMEYIGDKDKMRPSKLMEFEELLAKVDPNIYVKTEMDEVIEDLARVIKYRRLGGIRKNLSIKVLTNNPITLDKRTYWNDVYPDVNQYYICDKTDGIHCMVWIKPGADEAIVITDKIEAKIPLEKSSVIKGDIVIDGEWVDGKVVYPFDLLVYEGNNITGNKFSDRLAKFAQAIKPLGKFAKEKNFEKISKTSLSQMIKKHWKPNQTKPYSIDGLIFTPADGKYYDMKIYKWKPMSHLTIDFLIKKAPKQLLGTQPYISQKGLHLYLLFVGISSNMMDMLGLRKIPCYRDLFPEIENTKMYFPIQFSPSDEPYTYIYYSKENLDGQIGEFGYNVDKHEWKLLRIRTDRLEDMRLGNYYGNDYRIAEFTWRQYYNPIDVDYLTKPTGGYFKVSSDEHKPARAFGSFVKSKIMDRYRGENWLIDLASGKGQDLFRVADLKIKNALFIDNDIDALDELNYRKFGLHKTHSKLNINVLHADLNDNYRINVDKIMQFGIPPSGVNAVMCNLAIHYMIESDSALTNFIELISNILAPGGIFTFTTFNGQAVFDLLKSLPKGQKEWVAYDGEVKKYAIKKVYSSGTFQKNGQKIEVMLPFSDGEYMSEYLVNIDHVIRQFSRHGYKVEFNTSYSRMLRKFEAENKTMYQRMSDADKKWMGLYQIVSLYRVKKYSAKEMKAT